MSRKAKVLLVVLLCGALTANYLRLPLYFRMEMLFASVFTMVIIQLFGFRWGLLSAVISGTYSWIVLDHHFSGINFVCEAAVVGYLFSRRGKGLVFFSALYWVVLGMPMAWFYFHNQRLMGTDLALMVMLKQGINGIFNALFAKLLVTMFPLSPRLAEITGRRQVTFQQVISTFLAACVLFPLLTLTILSIREEFRDEMVELSNRELSHVAYHTQGAVQSWVNERLSDIIALTQLRSNSLQMRGGRTYVQQINELDRNILQVGVIDRQGISIAFDPPVDGATGRSNVGVRFADQAKLQAMRNLHKPVISGVMVGGIAGQAPVVVVDAPVVAANRFEGYVTGVLNLAGLRGLLAQIAADWSCKAVLLDRDRRVIAASEPTWKMLEKFELKGGKKSMVDASTYQWAPAGQGDSGSVTRWRQSYYVKEIPVGSDTTWRLVLQLPLEPRLHTLNRLFAKELSFMMVVTILTLVLSHIMGKRLVSSLDQLRDTTTGLPDMVSMQRRVKWPSSFIAEISSLIANFQSVTASLSDKFNEISVRNQELARENRERRRAEEELGRATSELTAIFQAFPDLCLVADAETTVHDCRGGKMQELYPWSDGVRGRRLAEVFPPDVAESYRRAIAQVLGEGTMATFEYRLAGEQGESFFETRLVPLSRELVVLVVRNTTDRKQAEELRISHEQLRSLSAHLEDARENERAHIAREIHDELGQQLTALRFDVGWINKKLEDGRSVVAGRVESMAQLLDRTIRTVRRIAMELRPRLLDDLGLVAALEWQVSEFRERTGIACHLQVERSDLQVERRRATALFRILQEALTNIIRHAEATEVDVAFREDDGMLVLEVSDNGKGISDRQVNGGSSFGIMGMHERAREWGGTVTVSGAPGRGTTISVTIPLGDKEAGNVQSGDL